MSVVFDVVFYPYSGCGYSIEDDLCKSEARELVAKLLKSRRNEDYPIITLERGLEWEICEPDDCFLVPDDCGLLQIQEREVFDECDSNFWDDYELMAS